MTTLPIIVYGNGDLFREYFNAIVTSFGKGNGSSHFKSLFHMAILLSGFTVIYSFILKRDLMVMVKWLGLFYVAVYVLFLPEATVVITDRVNNNINYAVDHVPLGLAVIASYTSTIGDALTQTIEAQFTMPDDLQYHRAGMVFASRLVEATSQFEVVDSQFDKNLSEFIHQCVFYDLLLDKYSINTLMSSPDAWSQVSANASPARAFVYNGDVTTCRDGARQLSNDWKQQIDLAAAQYGRRIYPAMAKEKAKEKLLQDLPFSYQYLTKLSDNATAIMQKNLMSNAMQRGILSMGATLNAPAALESYAYTRAQEQKRLTNKTLGDMAAYWLPLMKNAFEAIMYGSFIFVVLLSVFPFGWMVVRNYIYTLLWIQIWAPLYAIINLIVSYYAQTHSTAAVDGALSLQALSGLLQINSDISGLAGYLTLSVPFLSAGLVRGMASTFTHISQSLNGVTQSSGGAAAAEAVTGNISFGNMSLGNQNMFNSSANHSDTSGRINSGSITTTMAGGSSATTTADGSLVMDMRNSMSNLGASVNWAETLRTSYSQQAERSTTAAIGSAISSSQATSAVIRNAHELNQHIGTSSSSGDGWSVSTSSGVADAVSKVDRMTKDFADRHHISYGDSANVLASAQVSGQVSARYDVGKGLISKGLTKFIGIDGSVSGSAGMSRTAGHNSSTDNGSLFSQAQSYVKDNHFSENVDIVERAVKDQSFRSNSESGNRLVENMSSSFDQAQSYRNEMNSNLSHAESARVNASIAQDNSHTINANANQDFMEWMSHRPGTNGRGQMGLSQAESIMKDPNMQLYYAKQYSEQFKEKFEANWNHGMASNNNQIENDYKANNQHITTASAIQSSYQANNSQVSRDAGRQGLKQGQVTNHLTQQVDNKIDTMKGIVSREHQIIVTKGANEMNNVNVERNRNRHHGLTRDLLTDIDTKNY